MIKAFEVGIPLGRGCRAPVAVQDDNTDLKLGNVTFEIPRHEALAQQFHTMPLGFDSASAAVPSSGTCHPRIGAGMHASGARHGDSGGLVYQQPLRQRSGRGLPQSQNQWALTLSPNRNSEFDTVLKVLACSISS